MKTVHKEYGTISLKECLLVEFAESGCPIFRATTPLSRGQLRSKGHGKLSIHFAVTQETIETIFRIIVSANQLSLYGAVAEMCEESLHDRSGRPDMVMGQSIALSAIKTEVSLDCDDPTNQDLLLQQYGERIEKLSQQDKLSNISPHVVSDPRQRRRSMSSVTIFTQAQVLGKLFAKQMKCSL